MKTSRLKNQPSEKMTLELSGNIGGSNTHTRCAAAGT